VKLLLLGSAGQLGTELRDRLAKSEFNLTAVDRDELELHDTSAVTSFIRGLSPQLVVNAAAYTAVDQAESEPEIAHQVNAVAPGVIANECKRLGAYLVHYSTDYVFDGTKRAPYVEADSPAPLNVYGRTKLEGEREVSASGARHLILRVGWVYSPQGKNFLLTLLRLIREKKALRIVNDQIGVPTPAAAIADLTMQIIRSPQGLEGLFHFTPAGHTSWHGFGEAIVSEVGVNVHVEAIPSSAYLTPARRPGFSVLDSSRLCRILKVEPKDWRQLLRETITAMRASSHPALNV
jgi:dTDP-4-dehydrorhamnose reductase